VTTVPEATLNAFRDHGLVQPGTVMERLEEAERTLGLLPGHGVDLGVIADRLVDQGLEAFESDLNELLEVIAGKIEDVDGDLVGERTPNQSEARVSGRTRSRWRRDGEGSARIQRSPEALKGLSG
jgi:transaldolase/fructose-6-phosphate aldolase-like protein